MSQTPRRFPLFAGAGVVAVAALLVLWCCARPEAERPVSTPGVTPTEQPPQPPPGAPSSLGAAASPPTSNAALGPALDGGAPVSSTSAQVDGAPPTSATGGGAARIIDAVATRHPADLALLSRIERELRRDPPPEVHDLIRRRAAGATRDDLIARARLLSDLALRVHVLRWIDEVAPPPGSPPAAPVPATSGSATPYVKPITKTR